MVEFVHNLVIVLVLLILKDIDVELVSFILYGIMLLNNYNLGECCKCNK